MRDAFDITIIIIGAIIGCLAGGAMAIELFSVLVERVMPYDEGTLLDYATTLLGIILLIAGGATGLYLGAAGARRLISRG